jgi:hypothetical protein
MLYSDVERGSQISSPFLSLVVPNLNGCSRCQKIQSGLYLKTKSMSAVFIGLPKLNGKGQATVEQSPFSRVPDKSIRER